MAVSFHGFSKALPTQIRIELREPPLVKSPPRAMTNGEFPSGIITAATQTNPVVVSVSGLTPVNNTYYRVVNSQGMRELNNVIKLTNVSGQTGEVHVDFENFPDSNLNGIEATAYVPNSASICQLEQGSGTAHKYVVGNGLNLVREMDVLGARCDRVALVDMGSYAVTGLTITALSYEAEPYDMGLGGNGTSGLKDMQPFRFFVWLTFSAPIADGSYTITFPAGLGLSPQAITVNDKTTRGHALAANQIGHKPGDESKIAALHLKVPQGANDGAVDLVSTFSIADWHLIDANGTVVYSKGAAPVLRINGTTAEAGRSLELVAHDPLGPNGIAITNIVTGNPTTITAPGHGLTTGTQAGVLLVKGVQSSNNRLNTRVKAASFLTVTRIDDDTITYPFDTTGFTAYGGGGYLVTGYLTNLVGVPVWHLDFSDFVTAGVYRIWIPGFGVSDPINLDAFAWARWIKMQGDVQYNQSSGRALDGRSGYTRGADGKVGVDGRNAMPWLKVQHSFLKEQQSGKITAPMGSKFMTGASADEAWGGNHDAGDWDRLIGDFHADVVLQLLGLLSAIPKATRRMEMGLPKARDTIGGIYTRNLFCDPLEVAVWQVDWVRRCQAVDGGTPSVLQFNTSLSHPMWLRGYCSSSNANIDFVVGAPGPYSTASFAAMAAMIAWHMYEFGYTDLGDTWKAAAIAAYNYVTTVVAHSPSVADYYSAQKPVFDEIPNTMISANPLKFSVYTSGRKPLVEVNGQTYVASGFTGGFAALNGNTYALRTSVNGSNVVAYIDVYDATNTTPVDASGFGAYTQDTGKFEITDTAWATTFNAREWTANVQSGVLIRMGTAAGVLYTLTGEAGYKSYHEANHSGTGSGPWGRYIYGKGAAPNSSLMATFYSGAATYVTNNGFLNQGLNQRSFNMFVAGDSTYGSINMPYFQAQANCVIAHQKAYADRITAGDTHAQAKANAGVMKYNKLLQDAFSFLAGVNPIKQCLAIGYGQRWPMVILHVDSLANGVPPPNGIMPYYYAFQDHYINKDATYYWKDTAGLWDGDGANQSSTIIPSRPARCRIESYIPTFALVEMTEYDQGKSVYMMGLTAYLHAWEGSTGQPDGTARAIVQAV